MFLAYLLLVFLYSKCYHIAYPQTFSLCSSKISGISTKFFKKQFNHFTKGDLPMAKKIYTLSDILGTAITKAEAISLIKEETDADTFRKFNLMDDAYREKLLRFIMGKNGLAITYDSVFKHVMMPGGTTKRLESFLSDIMDEKVQIEQMLPRDGSQISEHGSFIIADIIVRLQNGSIINVEMQKIGYDFPGERASCYTADMIMRQYNYLKNHKNDFSYKDMNPVFLIIFMEKSPTIFHSTDKYIHQKYSTFDTGIQLNLLDNISFISLDTFKTEVHNVSTKRDAWLKFMTEDDPDEIVRFVNQYPEFLPCYHDLIAFRQNPKELVNMFSDALREMDKNTERYMVEELNKEVSDLKKQLNSEKNSYQKKLDSVTLENNNLTKRIAELEAQLNKA